jgi:hypothetical protein
MRWNGTIWKPVTRPADIHVLTGVAATSASNAWAVGFYDSAAIPAQTLALHWG